jgi:Ca2+-binding EF-hand superfamily protein
MGCAAAKDSAIFDSLSYTFPKVLSILELQQYAHLLMDRFIDFDPNGALMLDFKSFIAFSGVPDNKISRRLFAICDADGSGALDFREAIFLLWQLCTLDNRGLVQFLFDIYDEVNNNLIEYDDIARMLEDSYGSASISDQEVVEFIDYTKRKGVLTRVEFVQMCSSLKQTSRMIMDTQRRMRDTVLGYSVWENLTVRRELKTDPLMRPENWSRLMEKIIVAELEGRMEQNRRDKETAARTGRAVRHTKATVGVSRITYDP